MANTISASKAPDCTSNANYVLWAQFINSSLSDASKTKLVQTNGKLQAVWSTISKTLSSITGNGTIWTGTTSTAHGFRTGQIVSISGTTHFNGDFVLASASGTTFTITNATQNGVTDTGTFTAAINAYSYTSDVLPANALTLNSLASTGLTSKVHSDIIWSSGTTYAVGDVIWYNDGSGHYGTFISVSAANLNNIPNAATVGSTGNGAGGTKWKVWNYEMWQTNDGLQAAYMRLEYGIAAAGVPQLALQWSNAVTGTADLYAGSVGGTANVTNREFCNAAALATSSATPFECDFCGFGDGSGFICVMWRTATGSINSWLFGFERSRDNTGANTSNAITYIVGGGSQQSTTPTFKQCSLFLASGGASSPGISRRDFHANTIGDVGSSDVAAPGSAANSWQVGNNIPAAPVVANLGFFQPLLMCVALNPNDVSDGSSFSITQYGASHTYLAAKSATNPGWADQFGSNTSRGLRNASLTFGIRWE